MKPAHFHSIMKTVPSLSKGLLTHKHNSEDLVQGRRLLRMRAISLFFVAFFLALHLSKCDSVNCSAIQCVNETSFQCLEDALVRVNRNLKDLRAAIFQPNMPIPRYTILHYIYLNGTNKSYCQDLHDRDGCCKNGVDSHKNCGQNSWVWTRSSVYLLLSPGALDYLSFQSIAFLFTAIPRLNVACICLPKLCNVSSKVDFEKELTSKVIKTPTSAHTE